MNFGSKEKDRLDSQAGWSHDAGTLTSVTHNPDSAITARPKSMTVQSVCSDQEHLDAV